MALGRERPDVQRLQCALQHSFWLEAAFVDVPADVAITDASTKADTDASTSTDVSTSPSAQLLTGINGSHRSAPLSLPVSPPVSPPFSAPARLAGNSRRLLGSGQRRRLVGFVRCLSDGAFAALVVDACVHPDYQRQGIGRKLLKRLLSGARKRGPGTFVAFPRPRERVRVALPPLYGAAMCDALACRTAPCRAAPCRAGVKELVCYCNNNRAPDG